MKLHPRVTRTAVELVKRFEGLRRRAARLADGGWTLGYGHTRTAREGVEVTEEEAELLLYYDLSEVATRVDAWTFTPLNQNQFEALTAFAFNIGLDNFRRSTVLKRVNEGQFLQAAAAMELWRKAEVDGEGVVVDALVRRRAAEKAHFLTPPEGFKPSPTPVLRPAFDFSVIEAAAQSHAAQRTAEIETPLDGDEALAHVERAGAEPEPTPSPGALRVPPALAEATNENLVLHAPEPEVAEDERGEPTPADAREASSFEAPTADAPTHEPGPGLFDQPAPSPPPGDALPLERDRAEPERAVPVQHEGIAAILNNAVVLFGSIGCLGVVLFVLTVTSMLTGRANVGHLAIGLVAVALMTIAGIYFLMKRGGPEPAPSEHRAGGAPGEAASTTE